MAKKKPNGDVTVLIPQSPLPRKAAGIIKKWRDKDWELIDRSQKGDFLELRFRYKRYVLLPNPASHIIGPGQNYPTTPHPGRFLTREEAERAADGGRFIVDETEPPYEKMGVK